MGGGSRAEWSSEIGEHTLSRHQALRKTHQTAVWPSADGGIKAEEIETFYHKLSFRVTGETQQPLSEITIHRVHEIFQAMYNFALRKRLIEVSPFTYIHRAQVRLPDPTAPNKLAVAELLAYLRNSDLELFCAVNIAAVTGARRSEIIGMRWGDIDLVNATIRLTHGLIAVPKTYEGGGMIETNTKTGEIIADGLDVGQHLKTALTELRDHKFGEGVSPKKIASTFVFAADEEGKRPWHPDTMSSRLRKACEAKGGNAPAITLKDLRTFVASELVQQPFGLKLAKNVLRHKWLPPPYGTILLQKRSATGRPRANLQRFWV